MTFEENALLDEMGDSLDHYVGGGDNLNEGLTPMVGNPRFKSQFDLVITPIFSKTEITYVAGVPSFTAPTQITDLTTLPSELKNQVAAFLFGNTDFAGGFAKSKQLFPLAGGWNYADSIVIRENNVNVSYPNEAGNNDKEQISMYSTANKVGTAKVGSMIQTFYNYQERGGDPLQQDLYTCELVIDCKQVAYGSLLDSVSSDRFTINNIRYKLTDVSKLSQYDNQFKVANLSIFGRASDDNISPSSFVKPEQFLANITDVPAKLSIDKRKSLGTFIDYDVDSITLSIFVSSQRLVS